MRNYTTQMDAAKRGIITPEMKAVAAKEYISGALAAMLDLGTGSGPMNHAFALNGYFAEYQDQSERNEAQ